MIFCVEDDTGIRDLVVYTLKASGYEAEGVPDGSKLYERLKTVRPQLIILDIMLPGDDGLTILKKLRLSPDTKDIPVILATAKGTEYDKVIGLDLGADDYLAKPFGMMEMVSRVRAVLRRVNPHNEKKIEVEGLSLDMSAHTVSADGKRIELTLKEFKLLEMFMTDTGRVFSRDQLLENVWGTDFIGESRTVDVHMGTLRTKLGKYGNLIKTVRGVGYRMEVPQND